MARITVEDCLEKENNRFALVQLAAKRAKQLFHGSKALISDPRGNKAVVTALREIAGGKVAFMTEEEAREAKEQAELERERERENAQNDHDKLGAGLFVSPPPAAAKVAAADDDDDDDEEVDDEEVDVEDDDDDEEEGDDSDDDDDDDGEPGAGEDSGNLNGDSSNN